MAKKKKENPVFNYRAVVGVFTHLGSIYAIFVSKKMEKGDRVLVNGTELVGTVRYIGEVSGVAGDFVGVELDKAEGNPIVTEEQMHFLKGAALNLGFEELAEANPRLVYGQITGFGRTGSLFACERAGVRPAEAGASVAVNAIAGFAVHIVLLATPAPVASWSCPSTWILTATRSRPLLSGSVFCSADPQLRVPTKARHFGGPFPVWT